MQTTTKILLVAGVLSLTCVFHAFDLNDPRVDKAETFLRGDSRVLQVTGDVKAVYLLPLLTRLRKGDSNGMFFVVRGANGLNIVQIVDQDPYNGRVRRYCVSRSDCFDTDPDGGGSRPAFGQ